MVDWDNVRIQAAIGAMEALLENGKIGEVLETAPYIVVKQAVRMANCLVQELRRNKPNDDLEKEIKEDIGKMFKKK